MVDISKLKIGDRVYYQPGHYKDTEWENGLVKRIPDHRTDGVFVVYNCAGNWDRYMDYTAAMTNIRDLNYGWKQKVNR